MTPGAPKARLISCYGMIFQAGEGTPKDRYSQICFTPVHKIIFPNSRLLRTFITTDNPPDNEIDLPSELHMDARSVYFSGTDPHSPTPARKEISGAVMGDNRQRP